MGGTQEDEREGGREVPGSTGVFLRVCTPLLCVEPLCDGGVVVSPEDWVGQHLVPGGHRLRVQGCMVAWP
jgi:hypothetical protein